MRVKRGQGAAASATNQKIKAFLIIFFTVLCFSGNAQRVFDFKPQTTYQKQIILKSSGFVQRGMQKLDINSSSVITKNYLVNSSSDAGLEFTITIKKMDDVIDALGKRLHYNSENGPDPTSQIEKALHFMIDKEVKLVTDKYGNILSSTDPLAELASDSLLSFTGIQPEPFVKGALFSLLGDLSYSPSLQKGYTWADSTQTEKYKMNVQFEIEDISEAKTVVKFKSAIKGEMINSNSSGTFVVENSTGIIIEKLIYTVASGYEVLNRQLYATSRSTSLSETCKLIP